MTRTRTLIAFCAVLTALLILPTLAHAASITVSRNPAPPSAVLNDGAHALTFNYQASFTTTPVKMRVQIQQPNGTPVPGSAQFTSISGASSPLISSPQTYTVPAGLAPGRYVVDVAYYSSQFCNDPSCPSPSDDNNYEARAEAQFDVAASVRNIVITKFQDMNGDGIRQSTEPGVADWNFEVTVPLPDFTGTESYEVSTIGDGTATLSDVPAGPNANYTVSEIIPSPNPLNWAPTTQATQTFNLADGTADYQSVFGNAQQTSLCGTVYVDSADTGQPNTSDPVYTSPVSMTLGGTDGRGNAVSATTTTNTSGGYCFTGLMPGSYNVTETVPGGYQASWDVDGAANGENYINPIAVTSGQPSQNNNFGIVQPGALCGTIYLDQNHTGKPGTGNVPFSKAVTLTLSGSDNRGDIASATTSSAGNGTYCFNALAPGTYNVSETVPGGYTASWDADGAADTSSLIKGVAVLSGQTALKNDFAVALPKVVPATPLTKLCITKTVNRHRANQGAIVTYTIRVRDCGKNVALNVVVTDPLIGDATLVSTGHATLYLGQLVWHVGTLRAGQSRTFTYQMQFDRDATLGKHVNTVSAQGSNTNKPTGRATTTIVARRRPPVAVHVTG